MMKKTTLSGLVQGERGFELYSCFSFDYD